MSLTFDEARVTLDGREHRVLIAAPAEAIIAGRARLEELRSAIGLSDVDRHIISIVRRRAPLSAFVFRGRGQGDVQWRFDAELDASERAELAELMFQSHLPIKRELLTAGAIDNLYIDWGQREVQAFEAGLRRLRAASQLRLDRTQPGTEASRRARVDLWIAERISFYSGASLDGLLRDVLPTRLRTRDERRKRVDELLASLDDAGRR